MLGARLLTLGTAAILAVSLAACSSGAGAPSTPQPKQEVLPFQPTPPAGASMAKDASMDKSMSSDASMNPSPMAEPTRAPEAMMGSGTSKDAAMESGDTMKHDESMAPKQSMESEPSMSTGSAMQQGESMAKDPAMQSGGAMESGEAMEKGGPATMSKPEDRYVDYSPEAVVMAAQSGRAVLFFKASWCPTCNAADRDFTANLAKIPADVTVLKVDYDNSTDLKAKYMVTYQHTFIQVDARGNQVSRWNGGGLRDLIANLK